jgi:acyltransferase
MKKTKVVTTKNAEEASPKRLFWLDNAKALGIIAIIWGHLAENILKNYVADVTLQYKFIYSFHVPLFFILSGYIAKKPDSNIHSFIKEKFMTRIIPLLFFTVIGLPFYLINESILKGSIDLKQLLDASLFLMRGISQFNPLTWFLACLFSVELIHFFISPYLGNRRSTLCFFITVFYIIGWWISWKRNIVYEVLQVGDFWFIYEAIEAYSFYLLGKLLFTLYLWEKPSGYLNILLLFCIAVLACTFNLNQGPFQGSSGNVVLFAAGIYGNIFFFPLTAIAGSLFFMITSKFMGQLKLVQFIGRNTLIIMGLNGICILYLNKFMVNQSIETISGSAMSIGILCGVLTCVSLLICLPITWLLGRYLPQLTGRPRVQGPLLPRLLNNPQSL